VRIELHPEALTELRAAALWYEERQAGLGDKLQTAVLNTLTRIAERPNWFRLWPGAAGKQNDAQPSSFDTPTRSRSIRLIRSSGFLHSLMIGDDRFTGCTDRLISATVDMDSLTLIGNTPLVELTHCSPKPGVRFFAKLEGQNVTGSIKDRVVAHMIEQARARGALRPGQEIVEATTGNTGIALAMIGVRYGHPVRVVVPETAFPDILRVLIAYGARIEQVGGQPGVRNAIDVARQIAEQDGAYLLNQFGSWDNPGAHYARTGVEIVQACPEIDAFVCGVGTGGTIMGVGRRLREHNPSVRLVAAEPHPGAQLQGLRSLGEGYVPPILDLDMLDAKILVNSGSAFRAVREILAREGLMVGPSSGAAMHVALKWAQRIERGNIVVMFADSGWKYLGSPSLQTDELPTEEGALDDVLWW
jgi:[CysO sulfur-carrier protein]-thiocarboxylate-dependent cysteine synthase